MLIMKNLLIPIILLFLALSLTASANNGNGGQFEIINPLAYDTFAELIGAIINFIWYVSWVIAPIIIIIGGYYYMTAFGDPQKIKIANRLIMYAVIGFVLIAVSKGLIDFLLDTVLEVSPPENGENGAD